MKRIVIAGGTGFVGRTLQKLLLAEGYSLTIVSRNPERVQKGERVDSISWNDVEQRGLPECESVVQLTGELVLNPTRRWVTLQREVYESRVLTTLALRNAIARLHAEKPNPAVQLPQTFVMVTGVGYYKSDRHLEYDESSQGGDCGYLSKLVADWESAGRFDCKFKQTLDLDSSVTSKVQRAVDDKLLAAVHTVALRAGMVLGQDGGAYSKMQLSYRFGAGAYFGDGTQALPFIHVSDLANLILFSIRRFGESEKPEDRRARFTVLNAVAPQPCTYRQFADAFARSMGFGRAYFWIPEVAVRLLFDEERAGMLTGGPKVLPKRAVELGFRHRFPDIDSVLRDLAGQTSSKA